MRLIKKHSSSVDLELSFNELNLIQNALVVTYTELNDEFNALKKTQKEIGVNLLKTIDEFTIKTRSELLLPIREVKEVAQELDDNWLLCPNCQEAWQSQSKYGMVLCPTCNHKLHNPKFNSSILSKKFLIQDLDSILAELLLDELHVIHDALNEIYRGNDLWEFEIIAGVDKEAILEMLKTIREIFIKP